MNKQTIKKFLLKLMMPKLWQLLLKTSVVMIILSASHPVLAAEEVIFTHGILSQSVSIEELEQFALTGEMSPSVQFLFDYSKQNPEVVRSVLTQPLPTNQILMANLFNTAPGELVLGETSQLFHTKSHRSSKEALRATLIASAQDDNQISLLELLQNYPTTQVYIDSKSLGNTVRTVNNLVNTVENNFELPLTVLEDWIKGL